LTPVSKSQVRTLQEPHKSRIEKGSAWAATTEPRDTNPDELLDAAYLRLVETTLDEWNSPEDDVFNQLDK
jgi:hypothetical protein